jgi:putative heme transporter
MTMVIDTVGAVGDRTAAPRPQSSRCRWLRRGAVIAVLLLLAVELALGWSSLTSAVSQLHHPGPGWIAGAVLSELAAIVAYARMQQHLLRSAGVRAPLRRHLALAFSAHSLNESLPAGPVISTGFNYQQMRRYGAAPAVASWATALSGVLSAGALAVLTAVAALIIGDTPPWFTLLEVTAAGVLFTAGIRWVSRRPERLEPLAAAVMTRLNRAFRRPPGKGLDQIRGFLGQLRSARLTLGHGTAAGGLAVVNWVVDAAALWMCLRAVGNEPVSPGRLLLAFCVAMAAGTLTLIPGGLGIVDNALILGLIAGGVGTGTAIAAVVLYRIITLGFIIAIGWVVWLFTRTGARS